ncbi:site-specific integrase [Tenacibaculum piscium]|uniref:hypothetical protein n=1 Tax=Tenacibaculum piscium TaxID=1458515 RepID=UPI001F2E75D9|nr:hypothetical protein [Tenacibaculum piscium]
MYILNDEEIKNICFAMYKTAQKNESEYLPHIYFMLFYGCRIGETFNEKIQVNNQNSTISIFPQKKNLERILTFDSLETPIFYQKLLYSSFIPHINYKGLQRYIKKIMPIRNLTNGGKNMGAHLFRHNYIRGLKNQGLSIYEIDKKMGYTTQTVSNTYLESVIFY